LGDLEKAPFNLTIRDLIAPLILSRNFIGWSLPHPINTQGPTLYQKPFQMLKPGVSKINDTAVEIFWKPSGRNLNGGSTVNSY